MSMVRRRRDGTVFWRQDDVRGPDGRYLCRHCGEPSRPPWVLYCSPEHRKAFWETVPPLWSELRAKILVRDNWTCQICRARDDGRGRRRMITADDLRRIGLEVDHIRPVAAFPGLEFDEGNLRTLCHDCHVAHGARPRNKRWRAQNAPGQRRLVPA